MSVVLTPNTLLPDVGTLAYNGVTFSSLFSSRVSCAFVPDAAGRTTRFVEYTIRATGYVTLQPSSPTTIDNTMQQLRQLLSAAGGALFYSGRGLGNDLKVNVGTTPRDCAWGPIPNVLDFQPLGGSRSAYIEWQVVTRIPEIQASTSTAVVLQFNWETGLTYDEDGYTGFSIKGVTEIPLTRSGQTVRSFNQTVDDLRILLLNRIAASYDLRRYRITRRSFPVSRDKRTMDWEFAAEELEPFGQAPGCWAARGNYRCRPFKQGAGLAKWLCTLSATYPVRKDWPRRAAWFAFVSLLTYRMKSSAAGNVPAAADAGNLAQNPAVQAAAFAASPAAFSFGYVAGKVAPWFQRQLAVEQQAATQNFKPMDRKAWLVNFEFDEGIYKSARTTSFSATWTLITTFSHILRASGIWRQSSMGDNNNWRIMMSDIAGGESWNRAQLDPAADLIVDFGGGT